MAKTEIILGEAGGKGVSCAPDTSRPLGYITQKGNDSQNRGIFQATEDCIMVGNVAGESGYGATVFMSMTGYSTASADELITGVTGTARFGVNGSGTPQNWGIPIPKGAYLKSRTDYGTYNLTFYGMA